MNSNHPSAPSLSAGWAVVCKPGFEAEVQTELALRNGSGGNPAGCPAPARDGPGLVGWQAAPGGAGKGLPAAPLIFERQRLPEARRMVAEGLEAMAEAVAAREIAALGPPAAAGPWSLHVFAADPSGGDSLAGWAGRLERRLRRVAGARFPETFARCRPKGEPPGSGREPVLQLCAVPKGLWVSLAPLAALGSRHPGGVHAAPPDPLAPSRSFMKIEEALEVAGMTPRPHERAIDLGAAPGGWSYAFLKRGCRVLAVDNGPMKVRGLDSLAGELTHLRVNGITFRPPREWLPADWLLSDMLVPPGQTLGLLRRWLGEGWARRFIVNIKLPQRNPLVALAPIEAFLAAQPGLRYRIRQLHHDRREVTLMGEAGATAKPRRSGAGPRKAVKSQTSAKPRKAGRAAKSPAPSKAARGKHAPWKRR